jgi:peptidoglycan/LPS O-acetylase OafA/YrhL
VNPGESEAGADASITGPATAPSERPARSARFPCFDGLRAIAALSVLVGHVTSLSRANRLGGLSPYIARTDIGVAFFFLISGFLLYRPFAVAALGDTERPRLGSYLKRRILRIVPAYWVALTVSLFVFHTQPRLSIKDLVIFYGFIQIYDKWHILGGIAQGWTLCTEMSFYLFLPLWAWLTMRASKRASTLGRRVAMQLGGVGLLYAVSVAFRLFLMSRTFGSGFTMGGLVVEPGTAATWLPAMLDYFALGMLLAVASAWVAMSPAPGRLVRRLGQRPWLWWGLATATYWAVATRIGLPLDLRPYGNVATLERQLLYGLTAFWLLIPAVFGDQNAGLIRRGLRNPTVQWLGVISYGVYLWHEMWIHQFETWTGVKSFTGHTLEMLAFVLALSVAAAWLSLIVVERPVLRLKELPLGRVLRRELPAPDPPKVALAAGSGRR